MTDYLDVAVGAGESRRTDAAMASAGAVLRSTSAAVLARTSAAVRRRRGRRPLAEASVKSARTAAAVVCRLQGDRHCTQKVDRIPL